MTVKVLLSPSEVALAGKLKDGAIISPLPEQKGADILVYTNQGLIGLQRKEVPNDFISSFTDGRMARATSLLVASCKFTRIIAEGGKFKYWPDGRLVTGRIDPKTKKPEPSRFTRSHVRGMIFDIEFIKGIVIDWTDNLDDTVSYIRALPEFINRNKHLGLYTRPSAQGTWYVPTAKDVQLWLLQSFPGVGPAIADKIVERFDGVPLVWTCTLDELMSVPRLSKERAKEMYGALSTLHEPASDMSYTARLNQLRSLFKK